MNQQLIRDEGHRNAMSIRELEARMSEWLNGAYDATLFSVQSSTVGYALYRREVEWTYLRQFFILPSMRGRGIGRAAVQWLSNHSWRESPRIRIDVLVGNADAIAFWRAIGFRDYCITMEMETWQ
jgi:predicted acetyltransferase